MDTKQARLKVRKSKRKDIKIWYKQLKKDMKRSYYIQNGFCLNLCYHMMPLYGLKQAARLLCWKDKNYKIITGEYLISKLVWKDIKLKAS